MRRVLVLVVLLAASVARAQAPAVDDTAAARARFRAGTALFEAGKWREAAEAFEAAYRLKPHGAIHYNVAQCRERLGEWPAALRAYADYLRELPDAKDRAAVRASMRRVEQKLAASGVQALLIYTEPPGAEVRLDGKVRGETPFHTALPPGEYDLRLALDGYAPLARGVTVPADASVTLDLELANAPVAAAPAADPPPASAANPNLSAAPPTTAAPALGTAPKALERPRPERRLWTWVAAGASVVAASAGAFYGLAARDAESSLLDGRPHANADALAGDARSKAHTANVLFGVAGAAAATGVTLFFVEGRF